MTNTHTTDRDSKEQSKQDGAADGRSPYAMRSGVQLGQRLLLTVMVPSVMVACVMAFGSPMLWDVALGDTSTNVPVTLGEEDATSGEDVAGEQVEGELALYESTSGIEDTPARALNLSVAAAALDGVTIEPDEQISFNEIVGEATAEKGYQLAPDATGEEEVVGGGISQVASALHVAALEAGLTVDERHAHEQVVDYAPMGFDAMVSYDGDDLVIRNTTTNAVTIHAETDGQAVSVTIEGATDEPNVTRDVMAQVVDTYSVSASDLYDDPLAEGLLSSDSVRLTVVEAYLQTYRDGALESSEQLHTDTYRVPNDAAPDAEEAADE